MSQLLDLNGGRQVRLPWSYSTVWCIQSVLTQGGRGEGFEGEGGSGRLRVGGGGGGGGQKGKLCDCPGHHHLGTTTLGLSILLICLLLLSFLKFNCHYQKEVGNWVLINAKMAHEIILRDCLAAQTTHNNCSGAAFFLGIFTCLVPPNDPKCLCFPDSDPVSHSFW